MAGVSGSAPGRGRVRGAGRGHGRSRPRHERLIARLSVTWPSVAVFSSSSYSFAASSDRRVTRRHPLHRLLDGRGDLRVRRVAPAGSACTRTRSGEELDAGLGLGVRGVGRHVLADGDSGVGDVPLLGVRLRLHRLDELEGQVGVPRLRAGSTRSSRRTCSPCRAPGRSGWASAARPSFSDHSGHSWPLPGSQSWGSQEPSRSMRELALGEQFAAYPGAEMLGSRASETSGPSFSL